MTPTPDMIAAVANVSPRERHNARLLAETVFFACMNSPVMEDASHPEISRDWAGAAAAAEVAYRFA